MIAKFLRLRISATAGPERSARSPRAEESLTVRTAAVKTSGVEEDIFLFFLGGSIVTLGFVEHAQAFHQQALGVQRGGLFAGLALKVDLEVAAGPAQDFEDRLIAAERTVGRVGHLAFAEIHFAFVAFVGERKSTALASHFERLHQ